MKFEYTYKGVDIVLEPDELDDDPKGRVNGWSVQVAGRHLRCTLINTSTVLFLGNRVDYEDDDDDEDTGGIYAVDPGVLHATGRRFEVRPISTGRGRAVHFDYRALILMEDPPLEAIHPYVDHMLALRELYATSNVEKAMQGLVDDARRQPAPRSKV